MSNFRPGALLTPNLRLIRELGQGGMSTVWLAEHVRLETHVAVKVMPADLLQRSPLAARRFASEARAAAKINHPNIVRIFDHGTTSDGDGWMSMELLEGEPLRARIERGPVLPEACGAIVEQVAAALESSHALGVVHRDIKPENVIVRDVRGRPFVKVLDFGVALVAGRGRITAQGALLGTPSYMSPEQLRSSKDVDARADLWGLAVVAYEALTGRLPFEGETIAAMSFAVNQGAFEPPSALVHGLGGAIDGWFETAFARDLADRFATAEELGSTFLAALRADARRAAGPGDSKRSSIVNSGATLRMDPPEFGGEAFRDGSVAVAPEPAESSVEREDSRPAAATASPPWPGPSSREHAAERTPERSPDPLDEDEPDDLSPPRIPMVGPRRSARHSGAPWRWGAAVVAGAALLGGATWLVGRSAAEPGAATPSATGLPATAGVAAASPGCPSGAVEIAGGTYRMGTDGGDATERSVHEVRVASFCLDRTEVTVARYRECVLAGACTEPGASVEVDGVSEATRRALGNLCNGKATGRDDHPINCVDWSQARAFCAHLGMRLPTEEEWEYAARGGDEQRTYPWGDAVPGPTRLDACDADCQRMFARFGLPTRSMFATSDGFEATAPVGSFHEGAGRWGILDLAGNVLEWTSSGWSDDYAAARGETHRVVRGGAWSFTDPTLVRAAARDRADPGERSHDLGFRCAASRP